MKSQIFMSLAAKLTSHLSDNLVLIPPQDDVRRFLVHFQKEVSDFPQDFTSDDGGTALWKLGLARLAAGDFKNADLTLRSALAMLPDNAVIWGDLARFYKARNNEKSATVCISKALTLDDNQPQDWLLLATLLETSGKRENAVIAYKQSILLDDSIATAHLAVGMIDLKGGRILHALKRLRRAVELDPANLVAQTSLGHACFNVGEFGDAVVALEAASDLVPLNPASLKILTRAITFRDIINGDVAGAFGRYASLYQPVDDRGQDITLEAFSLLRVFGYVDAAVAVGHYRLAQDPDDAVQRHLVDALTGLSVKTTPAEVVEKQFDRMARDFDKKLVGSLNYRAPLIMTRLISKHQTTFERILDLGCGTGLASEELSKFGGSLIGVDLSSLMLKQAKERGHYSQLLKAEATELLATANECFDLVFAADVLVYIGDLEAFFEASARAIRPGGMLAVSIETMTNSDFELRSSGRFAHSKSYLDRLAEKDFLFIEAENRELRLEMRESIEGCFSLYRRK